MGVLKANSVDKVTSLSCNLGGILPALSREKLDVIIKPLCGAVSGGVDQALLWRIFPSQVAGH